MLLLVTVSHSLPAAAEDESSQMLVCGAGWAWLGAGEQRLLCVWWSLCASGGRRRRIGGGGGSFSCYVLLLTWCQCDEVLVCLHASFCIPLFLNWFCETVVFIFLWFLHLDFWNTAFSGLSVIYFHNYQCILFSTKICRWLFLAFCIFSSIPLPNIPLSQYPLQAQWYLFLSWILLAFFSF